MRPSQIPLAVYLPYLLTEMASLNYGKMIPQTWPKMAAKDQWGKNHKVWVFTIWTTHIFRLEKMQCATDLDPKPFDFLCWGPLMSSPLVCHANNYPPRCEVQSWTLWAENWQGRFLLGCWERCCGFCLLSFRFGENVCDPTWNACVWYTIWFGTYIFC